MIAKRTALKNTRGASRLIRYIADAKEKGEKLESFWMSNCDAGTELEDIDFAIIEINATQGMNHTSKADPNYHLVVSFAEGEKPDIDVLKDIEKEFADALGFSDHQRVVGTHKNTDNFHMHIMFNKVHPETFKMHTPYRDFKILQETCMVLEKRYGLRPEKGREEKKERTNTKAQDMEGFTWEKSFSSFLRENKDLLKILRDASSSWAEFHEKLDVLGVVIKKRGNGLVFVDQGTGVHDKASNVDRSFSKAELEKRFGSYVAIDNSRIGLNTDKDRTYKREPLDPSLKKHRAWKRFRKQKKHRRWRKFLESFAGENAEVHEALAIQQAYLSIFFGGKAPKTKERVQRPKSKGRSR
ncbi:Relaxase/Mobilisation nuclease domain-containing protein [Cohaesibacter marisflavi]|uniref:Relaxase/Mobilisation nuclease domain-containing protein n=1 Tax=Cohaesibacter marisflavi TaxID=655353 RepID=A0A1I5MZL2_9HYPH|nr:TraI/MobA(P) family conjugative relaxase [Cohaesibacter marisflavi]SFP14899.1 Relaxase/Mobilisation nuclease domain-containing protein [Cohaesibacter marisflavi]